jgi:hypothetical protein
MVVACTQLWESFYHKSVAFDPLGETRDNWEVTTGHRQHNAACQIEGEQLQQLQSIDTPADELLPNMESANICVAQSGEMIAVNQESLEEVKEAVSQQENQQHRREENWGSLPEDNWGSLPERQEEKRQRSPKRRSQKQQPSSIEVLLRSRIDEVCCSCTSNDHTNEDISRRLNRMIDTATFELLVGDIHTSYTNLTNKTTILYGRGQRLLTQDNKAFIELAFRECARHHDWHLFRFIALIVAILKVIAAYICGGQNHDRMSETGGSVDGTVPSMTCGAFDGMDISESFSLFD